MEHELARHMARAEAEDAERLECWQRSVDRVGRPEPTYPGAYVVVILAVAFGGMCVLVAHVLLGLLTGT
jgi:hypothetical protein